MIYLACGFIFGFWVGFLYFQKTHFPRQIFCKHCRKYYFQYTDSQEFCSHQCAHSEHNWNQ
jgi:hypothetical protein